MNNPIYSNSTSQSKDGGLAYFIVLETKAAERTYKIRTRSVNPVLNDILRDGIQQLSGFTSPMGDEDSCMVEAGASGICCFIGDVPFILGFFNPPQISKASPTTASTLGGGRGNDGAVPGSASGNRDSIDPGDKIIQTRGRCKIIWRRSGIIEIEATKSCRRVMYPSNNRIIDICRNYELTSDGLSESTQNIGNGNTLYTAIYKNKVSATQLLTIERGAVDTTDSSLIERTTVGAYTSGQRLIVQPNYIKYVYASGAIKEAFQPSGTIPNPDSSMWYRGINDDGSVEETFNNRAYSKKISPNGSVDISAASKAFSFTVSSTGAIALTTKNSLAINTIGNASLETKGSLSIKGQLGAYIESAKGKIKIGNPAVELIDTVFQICQTLSTTLTPGNGAPISTAAQFAKLATQIAMLKG